MCRWIAYIGNPIFVDMLVLRPEYSLVEQSLNAKFSFLADGRLLSTNGDGFGLGWYMYKQEPGLFKTAEPAWGNENIKEICAQIQSRLFMAHVRAASTGGIQRTNAHPFKYKNWLFQHNGYLRHFDTLRRELQYNVQEKYFPYLHGTTDSETIFLLALGFGLEADAKSAIERTILFIKQTCERFNVPFNLVMSAALSDGTSLYTFRFASGEHVHSQYYSTHAECMRDINGAAMSVPPSSVVVVSEPLDKSMEHWTEMPSGSFATIRAGKIALAQLDV